MTDHAHAWQPVAGERAQYACACGATGWRHHSGEIREHRATKARRPEVTVRRSYTAGNGRMEPRFDREWEPVRRGDE